MSEIDKTALSYWFPKLEAAGLPVPKTKLLTMPKEAQASIWAAFDGKEGGAPHAFFDEVDAAVSQVGGYPAFLRTDHTSGKHNWKDTCYLPSREAIPDHVFSICEFSECADMIGLPWSNWAVREFLPTKPIGICPRYGNMPINREFRFFVHDGKTVCFHPYWPRHALDKGRAPANIDFDGLCALSPEEQAHLTGLADAAARVLGEAWSVDILETTRGWYITDLAEAHKSFHWEGCDVDTRALA